MWQQQIKAAGENKLTTAAAAMKGMPNHWQQKRKQRNFM